MKPSIALVIGHHAPGSDPEMDEGDTEQDPEKIRAGKLDACKAIIAACKSEDAEALCTAMDTMHSLQHAEWGDKDYAGGGDGMSEGGDGGYAKEAS